MRMGIAGRAALALLAGAALPAAAAEPPPGTVFAATGVNAAAIQGVVDAFRAELGELNENTAGSAGSGRREIGWDDVPDEAADPNPFPADFFNTTSPRGIVLSTPGEGFLVSADADNATRTKPEFRRLNPTYPRQFAAFSPERLFTALPRANVTLVHFFVPGEATPALTRGFGAVFTDVDLHRTAFIELMDAEGALLRRVVAPKTRGPASLSFAGAVFEEPVVARVRVVSGNRSIGKEDVPGLVRDVVVMDDFIFGEPVAPASEPDPVDPEPVDPGPVERR